MGGAAVVCYVVVYTYKRKVREQSRAEHTYSLMFFTSRRRWWGVFQRQRRRRKAASQDDVAKSQQQLYRRTALAGVSLKRAFL